MIIGRGVASARIDFDFDKPAPTEEIERGNLLVAADDLDVDLLVCIPPENLARRMSRPFSMGYCALG